VNKKRAGGLGGCRGSTCSGRGHLGRWGEKVEKDQN